MSEPRYCCDELRTRSTLSCGHHAEPFDCADVLLIWSACHDTWGLPVRDGGGSFIEIEFCPWCAADLPVRPCSCGDTGWVDDENWSPDFPGDQRQAGLGRIPCGFCNEGNWSKPDPVTDPEDYERWSAVQAI